MVLANYVMMLAVGTVLALLVGLASHAAHAYLAIRPDNFWEKDIPGRWPQPPYRNPDYDSEGYWEFASLRNFLYHAGGCVLFVWGLGLWFFDRQELALAETCAFLAKAGIEPLFCG